MAARTHYYGPAEVGQRYLIRHGAFFRFDIRYTHPTAKKGNLDLKLFSLLSCLALVSACETTSGAPTPAARPPTPVQTITVEPTEIPSSLSAVGSLESPQTTELSTEIGGKIVSLNIPEGKQVKQGHVLARIDYEQAQAAVMIAQARSTNAKKTLERLKKLSLRARSQQALDDARAELDSASGQLADAQSVLRKTTIAAPFSGVLGLKLVSLGAYLDPGTPIVRLTQVNPLHLIFTLPQRYVLQLKTGQTVRSAVGDCAQTFSAVLSVIDPYIDPATRSVQIQAVVPNTEGTLLPGMAAAVRVEIKNIPNALLVPEEAIIRRGTKRLVYTVGPEQTVTPTEIRLGQFFMNRVQIEHGLSPGDSIVVAGHQKLGPGAKVAPQAYEPVANPNLALGADNKTMECEF